MDCILIIQKYNSPIYIEIKINIGFHYYSYNYNLIIKKDIMN